MNVSITADWQGKPLSALQDLIEKRARILKEDARDAVVATAINVITSLRALTRIARRRPNKSDYRIELTPYVASWERSGGKVHRVARVGGSGAKAPIFPVNLAGNRYVKGETVRVWRITPAHPDRMTWEKNRNDGCWYVFAQSEKVVRDYAVRVVSRRLNKYRGLAKGALGVAMSRLSTRSAPVELHSAKAKRIAEYAAQVRTTGGDTFTLEIRDNLSYAKLALKGGDSAISLAMMRAANRTAGRLAAYEEAHFFNGPRTATPFPEIAKRRSK